MTTGCNMRERLLRYQLENERELAEVRRTRAQPPSPGLRDMKDADWRQASADESSAMRVIGWMFVVALGIALGALTAAWWTQQPHLVAAAVECLK